MKNLNTDVIFFSGVDTTKESLGSVVNVYGMSKETPSVPVTSVGESLWGIQTLSFMLLVNASERKKDPTHDSGDTPENTVFFNREYEVCLRLTEPISGQFVDLGSYKFTPQKEQVILCRKTYSKKINCQYQQISVAKPDRDNPLCVLKVLVRLSGSNSSWIVQSIHPIRMVLTES